MDRSLDEKIISFEEFIKQHQDDLNTFALLFGNGLIQSYPEKAPCSNIWIDHISYETKRS